MKKWILLVALVAGALIASSNQTAQADCRLGYGVAYPSYSYYSAYSYPAYTTYVASPVYSSPSYTYSSYGYAPSYGVSYYRPGVSVMIGSGYRGVS